MIERDGAEIRWQSGSHTTKLRHQVAAPDLSRLVVSLQDVLEGSVRSTHIDLHTSKPTKALQATAALTAHPVRQRELCLVQLVNGPQCLASETTTPRVRPSGMLCCGLRIGQRNTRLPPLTD